MNSEISLLLPCEATLWKCSIMPTRKTRARSWFRVLQEAMSTLLGLSCSRETVSVAELLRHSWDTWWRASYVSGKEKCAGAVGSRVVFRRYVLPRKSEFGVDCVFTDSLRAGLSLLILVRLNWWSVSSPYIDIFDGSSAAKEENSPANSP